MTSGTSMKRGTACKRSSPRWSLPPSSGSTSSCSAPLGRRRPRSLVLPLPSATSAPRHWRAPQPSRRSVIRPCPCRDLSWACWDSSSSSRGVWAEWFEVEAVGKAMGVIGVLSFSFAQACLLSLAPLQRRHAWVFHVAVALILALAAIISGIIIFEPHDEDFTVRVVGVVAILDGCFSLCVPVLHRLGGKPVTEKSPQIYGQIELVCPRCGERGIYATGKSNAPSVRFASG